MREAKPVDLSKVSRINITRKPKLVDKIKEPTKVEKDAWEKIKDAAPFFILTYGEDVLLKIADLALPGYLKTILKYTGKAITYVAKQISVKK